MSKKKVIKNNNIENDKIPVNVLLNSVDTENEILFIENINLTTLKNMEFDNQEFNLDNDNDNDNDHSNLLKELSYENDVDSNFFMYNNNKNNESNERIKDKFYSYDEWYNNTILCWYCGNNFNNKPVFIPKRISNSTLDICGNFCSFPCSCKYINIYYKGNENQRCIYINNLKYLYKVFNNKEVNIIPESPDKEIMKKYGGFMTEQEYKEAIKKLKYI